MSLDAEDRGWLAAAARGDRGGLRRLYRRYAPSVASFVVQWSGGSVDVDDVVQDTFLAVWRSAGRYSGASSVKTWIFSIARNKAADRVRTGRREAPLDPEYDAPDLDTPSAERVISASQDADRVRRCVEGLSPAHRRAIELAFFEDLGYRDIAEIEKVPEGTIKTRIFHAKKLLMACLGAVRGAAGS